MDKLVFRFDFSDNSSNLRATRVSKLFFSTI